VSDALVAAAQKVMQRAYSPYSKFRVGAALEAEDGTVFTGCNVENASYSPTICAERSAMAAAVSAGQRRFRRIVITSDAPEPISPCGLCRQFMAEFGTGLTVISVGAAGGRKSWTLSDLLPEAFTGEDFAEGR
jgi:cytidine deaminase